MISYSLVQPDVKFSLVIKNKPSLRFNRAPLDSIGECICQVFGPTLLAQLEHIDSLETDYLSDPEDQDDDEDEKSSDINSSGSSDIISPSPQILSTQNQQPRSSSSALTQKDPSKSFQFRIEGYIPKYYKHSSLDVVARSSNDRVFIYVNNRPVDFPLLSKTITKAYRTHLNSKTSRYPFMLINIQIPTHTYDINLSPDKRKIFFHDQESVVLKLKKILSKVYLLPDALDYFVKSTTRSMESQKTQDYNHQNNNSNSNSLNSSPSGRISSNNNNPSTSSTSPSLTQAYVIPKDENENENSSGFIRNDSDLNLPSGSRISSSRLSRAFHDDDDDYQTNTPTPLPPFDNNRRTNNTNEPPSKISRLNTQLTTDSTQNRQDLNPNQKSPPPNQILNDENDQDNADEDNEDFNDDIHITFSFDNILSTIKKKSERKLLNQSSNSNDHHDEKSSLRVIGKSNKSNGFIIYDNKEIFIVNSSLVDESIIYSDLIQKEKLLCNSMLPRPLLLSEFNTSSKAWSVLQKGLSPSIEDILFFNGFHVKKESTGIYLLAVTEQIENDYGLEDLTEILEALVDNPFVDGSSYIHRPKKVLDFLQNKAKNLCGDFIPSYAGLEKSLCRLQDSNINKCPHGKEFKTRVYRIPTKSE